MKPVLLFLLVALTSPLCFAADSTTLVIPKITKPLVEPVEGDSLQTVYDKMWAEYEEALTKAREAVTAALAKQSDKAADTGELDLVEMWEGAKKQFADEGKLDWDTSPKAIVEWRKKYPKVPFPREVNEAVRNAANEVASAGEKLEEGYADLVKAYTKAKNIPRAKELREEGDEISIGRQSALELSKLIGVWAVRVGPTYTTEWTFTQDNVVASTMGAPGGGGWKGRWTLDMEKRHVLITWPNNAWDTLTLPLNPGGTSGDSIHNRKVSAIKTK